MEVKQGVAIAKGDEQFSAAVDQVVDYRGDVTLFLNDGSSLAGYVYDFVNDHIHIYPVEGDKKEVSISVIDKIEVTGKDTAEGKSWEAWIAKKKKEKEEQQKEAQQ